MKKWEFLAGMTILAIAIVIVGVIWAQTFERTVSNYRETLNFIADNLSSTLLTIADTN